MMKGWLTPLMLSIIPLSSVVAEEGRILDFSSAIECLIQGSPKLQEAQLDVEVREAEKCQVSLFPNPLLVLEVNDMSSPCNSSGVSASISQPIITGGKRAASLKIASTLIQKAMWGQEIAKQDALLELTHLFIDSVSLQERIAILNETCQVAEKSLECTSAQVQNGKQPYIQEKRAKGELLTRQVERQKNQRLLEANFKKLAALWGESCPNFGRLAYPFYQIDPPPSLEILCCVVDRSPEIELARWETALQQNTIKLEKARRIPDLDVTAGVTSSRHFKRQTFFCELDMALPIFDRNQGNIERARLLAWQAFYALENLKIELIAKLKSAWADWMAAYQAAQVFQELTTETAHEYFRMKEEGCQEGKWGVQEMLDAQKAWIDVKKQHLEALEEYHHKRAETMRLIAQLPCQEG